MKQQLVTVITEHRRLPFHGPWAGMENPVSLIALAVCRSAEKPFGNEMVFCGVGSSADCRLGVIPASMDRAATDATMLFPLVLSCHCRIPYVTLPDRLSASAPISHFSVHTASSRPVDAVEWSKYPPPTANSESSRATPRTQSPASRYSTRTGLATRFSTSRRLRPGAVREPRVCPWGKAVLNNHLCPPEAQG